MIYDELNYGRQSLAEENCKLMSTMTTKQRGIYDSIMTRVEENRSGLFFFMVMEELERLIVGEQCLHH